MCQLVNKKCSTSFDARCNHEDVRHVMPSADRKLELTAKASMAQPVSQPAVCSNGLTYDVPSHYIEGGVYVVV